MACVREPHTVRRDRETARERSRGESNPASAPVFCALWVCVLLLLLLLLLLFRRPRRRRGVRGRRGRRREPATTASPWGTRPRVLLSITVKSSPGCFPGGMVTSILSPLGGRTKMVCADEAVVSGIAKV